MKFNLTHARHDPIHCLAPGLFRSLRRGERRRQKLNVEFNYGEMQIEFSGPEPLGADDLRVLQGLVALAAIAGESGGEITISSDTKSKKGKELREGMALTGTAAAKDLVLAESTFRQFAAEIGYASDSGGVLRLIRSCIERLWKVSIIVKQDGRREGFRILSGYASGAGGLCVSLNPRIAAAIVGGRHARIDMAEVRALKSDQARLLHQRLCGFVDPGKGHKVVAATLCGYVWHGACGGEGSRRRLQVLKKALLELKQMGWEIEEYSRGRFDIRRPAIKQGRHALTVPKACPNGPNFMP
jgi:hypothetical protein